MCPSCSCSSSSFNYAGDVNIVNKGVLKSLILKDPIFRKHLSLNWDYNLIHVHNITLLLEISKCNPTHAHSSLPKEEIFQNHVSFKYFHIPNKLNEFELPYLYWLIKLHKNP